MFYEPFADRVIIEPATEDRVTRGGIIVPDAVQNHRFLAYGTVIAVGEGRINAEGKCVPLRAQVGDVVCWPRKESGLLPLLDEHGNERTVVLLREAQILGRVHGMPQPTRIVDTAGAPLSLVPQSIGLPDTVYENREGLDRAKKEGWIADDIDDHQDDSYGPGRPR